MEQDTVSIKELKAELGEAERRLSALEAAAQVLHRDFAATNGQLAQLRQFLDLAPRAAERLEELSKALFGEILDEVEANLTKALKEILDQERVVRSVREIKGNRLSIEFYIENQGREENILTGQGGSVCNLLSVGLRLIALSRLDPARHRPFLILDEQDCWLKPELVPKFMKIIAAIADKLGIQVLVISHHPLDLFALQARKIFRLSPDREKGVSVTPNEQSGSLSV